MSTDDGSLSRWLADHGLSAHLEAFVAEAVDLDVLAELTDEDLRSLGLPLGDRKRFRLALADTPPAGQAGAAVEQRNLTVLFCDLVESTTLATSMDREDYADLVRRFAEAGRSVVEAAGGTLAKHTGDGFMAFFGHRYSSDDDAARAVRAGLDMQLATATIDVGLDVDVRCRIGLASGLALVGQVLGTDDLLDAIGDTLALAARVESTAPVGSVCVADVTRRIAGERFEYEDLGLFSLKGFEAPVRLHRVAGIKPDAISFSTTVPPAYGRDRELAVLRAAHARAERDGAVLVRLLGDPGSGKSRLVDVLGAEVVRDGWRAVRFGCAEQERGIHAHPLRRALASAAGLRFRDDPSTRDRKLVELAGLLGLADPDPVLSLFAGGDRGGADVSPADRRASLLATAAGLVRAAAAQAPLLLVVEDIHWADATTVSLVETALRSAAGLPVLIAATARPTLLDDAPPFGADIVVEDLEVDILDADAALELVSHVGGRGLDRSVAEEIVERGDGVPLFLEELTRAVVEAGPTSDQLTEHSIPLTLHDTLMARLDRLGPGRRVAPAAAVLGREFSVSLLRAVVPDLDVDAGLDELIEARLVDRAGTGAVFRHALLRDLAYETMVRADRRAAHDRAARALVEEFPTVAESAPHVVAHHHQRGVDPVRSVEWWLRAARIAARHSASTEVINSADAALEVLATAGPDDPELDRLELELTLLRAGALRGTAGFAAPVTGAAYRRARELSVDGDDDQRFAALNGSYSFHLVHDEYDLAGDAARDILDLARRSDDGRHGVVGHRAVGAVAFHVGRLAEAEVHLSRSVELYRAGDHAADRFVYGTDHATTASCFLSLTQWVRGRPAEAVATSDGSIAHAESLDHVHSWAQAVTYRCFLATMERDWATTVRLGHELEKRSSEAGLTLMEITARFWVATGTCFLGEEGAIEEMHAASREWWATGARSYFCFRNAVLAEAHASHGHPERGMVLVDAGLERAERTGERWAEAESRRVRGSLLARTGRTDQARTELCRAVDVADAQDAQMWALRAELCLASLDGPDPELRRALADRVARITPADVIDVREVETLLAT